MTQDGLLPLIIDCDPGVDDAVALFLAFAARNALDLVAVTTVGGNVSLDHTTRNARILRQIARREDVPVFAGAARPLVRAPVGASEFHGATGLGDMTIFEPGVPAAPGHAAQAIVDAVMSRPPGAVAVATMGPLTNLALAMRLEPALASRLGTVSVMGGARSEGGNITASAEYNIHADPHAADIVMRSGCELVVFGLDATHQVRITADRAARFAAIDTPVGRATADLFAFANRVQMQIVKEAASPLHDPCPVAWFLAPQLFETTPVDLQVECVSPLTLGHTAVEFRLADPAASRIRWVTRCDAAGVFDLLAEGLAQ